MHTSIVICLQDMKTRHGDLQKNQQAIEKEQNNLARHLDDVKARKVRNDRAEGKRCEVVRLDCHQR